MLRLLLRATLPALLAVAPAWATGSGKLEPPDLEQYLRWGPLRVRPGLTVGDLGYDDNILVNDRERVSDYRATVSPKLAGLVLLGDSFLTFNEQVDYTAFLENDNQNYWSHVGSGRLTVPLGNFGVFAGYELLDTRERPLDREDVRRERQENQFGAGGILRLGWRTELELGHRRKHIRFDDEDPAAVSSRDLNRIVNAEDLALVYRWRGRTRLTLDGSYKDVAFDVSPGRDATQVDLLPGVQLGEGGPLTGELRVGWSRVAARDPGVPDLSGVVGDAELAWRLSGGTRLRMEFERSQHFAVDGRRRYYRLTRVGLRAVHYLNRIVGVEAGGSLGEISFSGSTVPLPARRDDLLRYETGVRLRVAENPLGRKIEYVLRVRRYDRDSTEEAGVSRTSWGIDAVLGF